MPEVAGIKYIYVGMQRCGTTSFGDFFRRNGLRICSWREIRDLSLIDLWYEGRWVEMLERGLFDHFDAFEDGPFWDPGFAKFLSHAIPQSRFVYFSRPATDWYKSMVVHSKGFTLGELRRHCYRYDRLEDLHLLDAELDDAPKRLSMVGMRAHYETIYRRHQHQIREDFRRLDPSRVFAGELYAPDKFEKLNAHFGLGFADTTDQHSHKSKATFKGTVSSHGDLF